MAGIKPRYHCCVVECVNHKLEPSEKISFHRFPKDAVINDLWIKAIFKKNFEPSTESRVCDLHFLQADYLCYDPAKRFNKLRKTAVPSFFSSLEMPTEDDQNRKLEILENVLIRDTNTTNSPIEPMEVCKPGPSNPEIPISPKNVGTLRSPSRATKKKRYVCDFKESDMESHRDAKLFFKLAVRRIAFLENKNRNYRRKLNLIGKSKLVLPTNDAAMVGDVEDQQCLPKSLEEIVLRTKKLKTEKTFSSELRTFALTLNFYSPSAYQYVRTSFGKSLPHSNTLRNWYSCVDGRPGYTVEALSAIKTKGVEMANKGKTLVGTLVMDEISIRQHVQLVSDRVVGYENLGFGALVTDLTPLATEALMFLFVALNDRWKVPVGYFLSSGLNAEDKAKLVKGCFMALQPTNVPIVALTFDGTKPEPI